MIHTQALSSLAAVLLTAGWFQIATAQQTLYGQCGGNGWTGPKSCGQGAICSTQNAYYAQCTPATAAGPAQSTLVKTTKAPTSAAQATPTRAATSARPVTSKAPAPAPAPSGRVQYAGVNIAGFDFGQYGVCGVQGTGTGGAYPPLASNGGPDGIGQMNHFVTDDGLNAFRLPVTWQYLINRNLQSNTLDATNFGLYNQLVQGCLNSGAKLCIIDMHNYARYEGSIIGQDSGASTAAQFASLWSQLARRYSSEPRVAFGLMNEPNDSCSTRLNISLWGRTLQSAVSAIRSVGATTQPILLPGNFFSHPDTYTTAGGSGEGPSAAAILGITDPSGGTNKLWIDIHKYLDADGSGTSSSCSTSGIPDDVGVGLASLTTWARRHNRVAFLSEFGAHNDATCAGLMKQMLGFLNGNADVWVGWTAWAAGGIGAQENVNVAPTKNGNGGWTDGVLVREAVGGCFRSPGSCAA